jgi:hypothetical protein
MTDERKSATGGKERLPDPEEVIKRMLSTPLRKQEKKTKGEKKPAQKEPVKFCEELLWATLFI